MGEGNAWKHSLRANVGCGRGMHECIPYGKMWGVGEKCVNAFPTGNVGVGVECMNAFPTENVGCGRGMHECIPYGKCGGGSGMHECIPYGKMWGVGVECVNAFPTAALTVIGLCFE